MARNKYAGICYRCGGEMQPGDGYFEKVGKPHLNKWPGKALPKFLQQHEACAKKYGGTDVHYQHAPANTGERHE